MQVADPQKDVEYVPEQLNVKGSVLEAFSDVFARFQLPPESSSVRPKLPPIASLSYPESNVFSRTQHKTQPKVKSSIQMMTWPRKAIPRQRRRNLYRRRKLGK